MARMRRLVGSAWLEVVLVAIALATAAPASAQTPPDKEACATAYEQGQRLQRAGSFHAAREQLLVCARDPCPSVLQADCARWLATVEEQTPRVTFAVTACDDASCAHTHDVAEPGVTVDGAPLVLQPGLPAAIDPGSHTARVVAPGAPPEDVPFVLQIGEKRRLDVRLRSTTPAPPPPRAEPGGPPAVAWILGGVGVAALASFTVFAVMGKSQQTDTLDACRPECSHSDVVSVRTKYTIADVSLAVSVLSLAAATYFFLTAPSSARTGLALRPDGALAW